MTTQHQRPQRPPTRLGTVALLTALLFACTTIRAPVSAISSPIPIRDGSAEPQLELWLESATPVTPDDAARASAEASAALEAALAGREVGDGSTVLVVREQGVTRAPSHRRDQATATVGLVVGAVVVVVGLIWWLSRDGSGGGGAHPAKAASGRGGGRPLGRPPAVSPALPVARAVRPPPPPRSPASPRPPPPRLRDRGPPYSAGLQVHLVPAPFEWVPGAPVVISSRELPGPAPALEGEAEAEPTDSEAPPAAPAGQVVLPPLAPFPIEARGFFDGDRLVLELTLVDRITGEPRWTKWIEEDADPCDRKAVRKILDRAFAEAAGWQPGR